MTGGQVSPTTLLNSVTMTTPYGSKENPFDICELAVCAGATYVSRWITAKPIQTIKSMKKALQHKGFSMIEMLSTCPTNWGMTPVESMEWVEKNMIPVFPLGVFKEVD